MGLLDNLAIAGAGAGLGMITGERERMNTEEMNAENIRQQMESAKHMTVFNREQQMKMWRDTNYSAQIEEMKKAGLNVGLMYGNGGGGGASTNVATSQGASGQAGTGRNDIQAGMGIMLQNALLDAQRENIEADTENKKAQTENTGADTIGKDLANKWEKFIQDPDGNEGTDGTPLKETEFRTNVNERRARIQKIDKEMEKLGIDISKGNEEIERIKTDTNLQKQLLEFREEMNPIELEKLKSELEVYKKNPQNNEIVQWIETILGMGNKIIKPL